MTGLASGVWSATGVEAGVVSSGAVANIGLRTILRADPARQILV